MQWIVSSITMLIIFLATTQNARAEEGWDFSLSLFYQSSTTEVGSSSSDRTETFYPIKFGYVFSNDIHLGAIYHYESVDTGTQTKRTSVGGSVGWIGQNVLLFANYFFNSTYDPGDGNKYKGNGVGFDLTYLFGDGSQVRFGPQLSYKSFAYTEDNSGSIDVKHSGIDPYLTMFIRF